MPTYGFSAFLKLLSLNARPQRTEVRRRLSPSDGGYDFHRSLRLRVQRMLIGGESLEAVIADASELANPAERQSVENGLRQFAEWLEEHAGEVVFCPPALYTSPASEFSVSFLPDFGYVMDGQVVGIHVWNTRSVDLNPRMTYAALAMIEAAYYQEDAPDDVAVLSLPDRRLYRLSDVVDQSRFARIVASNLDALFDSVRDELGGPAVPPEGRLPPTTFRE